jgi:YggT family protein
MNNYLSDPLVFLIEIIFSLYIMVVMLRFLFQLVRADFYNPISQFIVTLTNPLLRPLRRIIPSVGKIDMSSIVLMLLLQYLSLSLITLISGGYFRPLSLLVFAIAELINLTFNVYIFSLIILAVFSWINPGYYNHPLTQILGQLTNPLMRPARKLLPPVSGIDLSPMLVIIALFFFKLLLIPPLHHIAKHIYL